MEFFEKAHLPLSDDSKKDKKPDEKIKKQLKQMLYGYKKSDNELIRKCENVVDSDSTSVSGFSDLNLSNANSDNETTRATLDSSDLDSISNLIDSNEASLIEGADSPNKDVGSDVLSNPKSDRESPSEMLEDNDMVSTFDSSNISTTETKSDTGSSTLFDPDGELAQKIHNKLNSVKLPHEKLKRKMNDDIENSINSASESEVEPKVPKKENDDLFTCDNMQFSDYIDIQNNGDKNRVEYTVNPISTFVSVTSKSAKTERFDDIMGHYRNATVKNISIEHHDVSFSPLNYTDEDDNYIQVDSSISDLGIEENVSDSNLPENTEKSEVQNDSGNDNSTIVSTSTNNISFNEHSSINSNENFKTFNGNDCIIIIMKHPSELFIHGKVIVSKLGGCAQLYGFNLSSKPYFVYAPIYNFAHCVRTLQGTNFHVRLYDNLISKGVSTHEAKDIVANIGSYDVVLALTKLNSTKMEFIESNFGSISLFDKNPGNVPLNLNRAYRRVSCCLYSEQPYKHFKENPNWEEAARFGISSGDTSIGMVCGGKGSGKSTFLRYYVNRQVSCNAGPVLLVDLDPGQCEFTIAGSISATYVLEPLLGPNYTHLTKPDIMLNIGMINVMDNPKRYLNAVDQLITKCKEKEMMSSIPWIVNTMGMCNAMGLKLISYIILRIQPTYLLQIELPNMKKNFPHHLTSQKVEELYKQYKHDRFFAKLSRQDPLSYAYLVTGAETFRKKDNSDNAFLAPRDQRYLSLLAYFGELARIHHTTTSLLGITPYSVRLQDLYVATNIKIHRESITKVLNGKVVALCKHTDKTGKVFTLTDKPLICYGHGLIRGIEKDILYIITPVSHNDLTLVNTVLYADWMPELRGQEKYLPEDTVVPYRMLSHYQQRELLSAPRRRFNPIQLLKMSKDS